MTVSSPYEMLIGRPVDRMDHPMFDTTEAADGRRTPTALQPDDVHPAGPSA
jgi:hypothetical protein